MLHMPPDEERPMSEAENLDESGELRDFIRNIIAEDLAERRMDS